MTGGVSRGEISDLFFAHPKLLTLVLLLPPLLWIGIVYVGSLFALLLQSFYSLDDFSGLIVHEFTLVDLRAAAARRPISRSSCAR